MLNCVPDENETVDEPAAVVLKITVIVESNRLHAATSGLQSPLKSAVVSAFIEEPAEKFCKAPKEGVHPPGAIVLISTDTLPPLISSKSGLPSKFISADCISITDEAE